MTHEKWFSGERMARASVAAVTVLGVTAAGGCTFPERRAVTHAVPSLSPTPSVTASPTPQCLLALEQFSIVPNHKIGGAYAINEGDCVNVYAQEVADTPVIVSEIPTEGRFYVDCYDLTASSLRVVFGHIKGHVELTEYALQQLDDDPSARNIRTC